MYSGCKTEVKYFDLKRRSNSCKISIVKQGKLSNSSQGHREFPFGKLKIPPPLLHKIPGDPITSYGPLRGLKVR